MTESTAHTARIILRTREGITVLPMPSQAAANAAATALAAHLGVITRCNVDIQWLTDDRWQTVQTIVR